MEAQSAVTKMQDSWVEVQEQSEGTLAHPSSKEELKQMLASAASEEEEELSDTDMVYQVKFSTMGGEEESQDDALTEATEPKLAETSDISRSFQLQSPVKETSTTGASKRSVKDEICSLSLLVPVLILTHLAMFGIGYLFGRRCPSGESGFSAMKVFHV